MQEIWDIEFDEDDSEDFFIPRMFIPARKMKEKLSIEDILPRLRSYPQYFSSEVLNNLRRSYKCYICGMDGRNIRNKASLYRVRNNCSLCRENLNDEYIKKIILSGEQKLKCPKCLSDTIKNAKKEFKNSRYKDQKMQKYKCLKCGYRFTFEKLYDNELAKETALKMFYDGFSYYKIGKTVGRKADTVAEWVGEWLYETYPDIYEAIIFK